jgi:REP element-mobilizing transposase RayT
LINDRDRRKAADMTLDSGLGACALRDVRIASVVETALLHFDDRRYRLLAWCIMPNHVHAVIEQLEGHSLTTVVQSWKSFTAKQANAILRQTGRFWAPDYFDRYVRDETHLAAAIRYAEENPVKAGLAMAAHEWRWSSAHRRCFVPSLDSQT